MKSKLDSLETWLASLENENSTGSTSWNLSSYATKSDLSQYHKLNDLVYHNHLKLPIKSKEGLLDNHNDPQRFNTSNMQYHEGTHLIGKYTDINEFEHEIDIVFKTKNDISDRYYQNCVLILKECDIDWLLFFEY